MALDKNGKTQLPAGITWRENKQLYMARFMYQGESHTSYHKDLKSAKKWLADAKYEAEHGLKGKADKISLNVWYESWLEDFKRPNIKPTSIHTYEQTYDGYIRPALGGMHLAKIKTLHIQKLVNSLVEDELSPKFIKCIFGVLYDMLEIACENDLIIKNPAKTVTLPKPEDVERRVLSADEQSTLLTYAKRDKWLQFEPLLVTLLGTGMRIGECLGLTWDDVDFENNVISINKTLTYLKGTKEEKSKFTYQTPKTKSGTRTIPLLSEVVRALKRQKVAQARLRLFMGPNWEPLSGFENLVFTKPKGTPYQAGDIRRFLNRIVEEINREEVDRAEKEKRDPVLMEHVHPHALRHSFATRAIENGMPPKTLQKIMGHAKLELTMDLYVHVTDQTLENDMQRLEGIFSAVNY